MGFFKKTHNQLLEQAIEILREIKANIRDNSDCIWTSYESSIEIRKDIDKYISELERGNTNIIDETYCHFLPTSTYQEHSMANNWTKEYHKLASKFDKIYGCLKNGC